MHVNQQSPTIGVEIVPKDTANPDAYFAPAYCAVFREQEGDNEYCYVHLTSNPDFSYTAPSGSTKLRSLRLIGFTTADGIESKRGSIFKQLQHISVVNTGLVTLLCPPQRAKEFHYGDLVYIDSTAIVPLRRKPDVKVATFTYESPMNALVGRFIETCGQHGGIRVKLDIR